MIHIDASDLQVKATNLVAYQNGYSAGIEQGIPILLAAIGETVVEAIGRFIDMQAAGNPAALHHMYEWYQAGSSGARLFEFDYSVGGNVLTFSGATSQSSSIAATADRPFYNKAEVMESGQGVTISPTSGVLAFEAGGQTVFTANTVYVANPGGAATTGSFQRVVDLFFGSYLSQALLQSSGMYEKLSTATEWSAMFGAGVNGGGYGTGVQAGLRHMIGAAPKGGLAV